MHIVRNTSLAGKKWVFLNSSNQVKLNPLHWINDNQKHVSSTQEKTISLDKAMYLCILFICIIRDFHFLYFFLPLRKYFEMWAISIQRLVYKKKDCGIVCVVQFAVFLRDLCGYLKKIYILVNERLWIMNINMALPSLSSLLCEYWAKKREKKY